MKRKIKKTSWIRLFMPFIAVVGLNGLVFAGPFDPDGPPAPTMITLEHVKPAWNKKLPDSERFVDVLDGNAILDSETGLVWEKLSSTSIMPWADALASCYTKKVDGRKGWRLPKVEELSSLVDLSHLQQGSLTLPIDHPFRNVTKTSYWSTTTSPFGNEFAFSVHFTNGFVSRVSKSTNNHAWCVRGGS